LPGPRAQHQKACYRSTWAALAGTVESAEIDRAELARMESGRSIITAMPTVSEFFGISICFYFGDHQPPHFHAFYGEFVAQVSIDTLRIMRGRLPPRVYGLVAEWAMLHREELRRAWEQAAATAPFDPIAPLTIRLLMERIVAAQPLANFRLWLRFTDGVEGEVDLAHLVGCGVFSRWSDPAEFAKVIVDPKTRTVCWPWEGRGIDLDPDVLYAKVTGKAINEAA